MKNTVYAVMVQGWGDREEEFYNCGTYDSLIAAEQRVEFLLQDWERSGMDRADVVWEIERLPVRSAA